MPLFTPDWAKFPPDFLQEKSIFTFKIKTCVVATKFYVDYLEGFLYVQNHFPPLYRVSEKVNAVRAEKVRLKTNEKRKFGVLTRGSVFLYIK